MFTRGGSGGRIDFHHGLLTLEAGGLTPTSFYNKPQKVGDPKGP